MLEFKINAKFKTRAKRAGRQYGQRNVSPQKRYNLCLGLLNMVSNPTFLLYPPSFSHDICALIFLFFLMKSPMISSRKGERQKRSMRSDSRVQQAEEGTGY